jgi:maleylacetoacetate isomerase/maleylpyruvate isomerase
MSDPVILYDYALSSACYRVRIALNLKGIAYESRTVALRDGEQQAEAYRSVNPSGLIPTLEIDGLRLGQSLAIIDYLDASHPEPRLVPRNAADRSRVLAMALAVACDVHPLNNLRVLRYLKGELAQDQPAIDRWYGHWIAEGFAGLEAMLTERPPAPFAAGAEPGLADICIVPQIFNARRFAIDLAPYPRLVTAADHAAAHPAFRAAAPA